MSQPNRNPFDGLAVRVALLLAAALIVANVVAAALLYVDRARQDSEGRIEREVERLVSLVPAIEAAPPARRAEIAREASTRVSRVTVDRRPIVEDDEMLRAGDLVHELREALPGRDVRAALLDREDDEDDDDHGRRRTEAIALSIRLSGDGGPQWLNSVSQGGRAGGPPGLPQDVLFLILGISLVSVLGVAMVFLRLLPRPLTALASAAQAAGQGDRSVRVPETGPRELRAASAAFNEMQERIGAFDAERMRTLAAVGHDLRTPITSLRIRAEMLDEAEAAPMIRTLDEMTVMADGLVAYARGAGEGEAMQQVELAEWLARLCAERGAEFTGGGPMPITVRPVALGRAIGNLVDNALRYAGAARVALARQGGDAVITVEDDGPGIPPDRMAKVLEPFVRGDDSRSLETGGAGLGLSIARSIVAAHGGALTLENRTGGGLRATVCLPADP